MSAPAPAPGGGGGRVFLRGIAITAGATAVSNALLFVVSLIAARALVPADYAVVATMLAVVLVLAIPGYALQVAVARELAGVDGAAAREILAARVRGAALAGGALAVAGLALAVPAASLLQLDTIWPYAVTVAVAPPLLVAAVLRGGLQAQGAYRRVGTNMVAEAAARLAVAIGAVLAGAGATGVAAAPLAGVVAAAALGLWWLRPLHPGGRRGGAGRGLPAGYGPVVAHYAGFTLLVSADLVVAKASLAPDVAGQYAAAAFIGKVLLLLPTAVTLVLVPEVAARVRDGRRTGRLLAQAYAITLGLSLPAIALCVLAPGLVTAATVGPGYEGGQALMAQYSLAALVFALVSVQSLYAVARGRALAAWAGLTGAVIQLGALVAVAGHPGLVPGTDDPSRALIATIQAGGLLTLIAVAAATAGGRARRGVAPVVSRPAPPPI